MVHKNTFIFDFQFHWKGGKEVDANRGTRFSLRPYPTISFLQIGQRPFTKGEVRWQSGDSCEIEVWNCGGGNTQNYNFVARTLCYEVHTGESVHVSGQCEDTVDYKMYPDLAMFKYALERKWASHMNEM